MVGATGQTRAAAKWHVIGQHRATELLKPEPDSRAGSFQVRASRAERSPRFVPHPPITVPASRFHLKAKETKTGILKSRVLKKLCK